MSSKLVKAFNVVSKTEEKVVIKPVFQPFQEDMEIGQEDTRQKDQMQQELVLAQLKAQAENEWNEWKEREQELFLHQLEEEKRRGYNEGYQLGIDEGKKHGLDQYMDLLQKANALLEQAYQEKMNIIQEAEPFVVELSVEIAKKVLQQELETNHDALIHLIKESLSSVYESPSLSISVSPDDFSFVQKQREQLLAVVNGQVEVKIIPDYTIQQGGCIIRTSSGSVDARIDVQLSEIKKALLSFQEGEAL